jgi:hypothetical protein
MNPIMPASYAFVAALVVGVVVRASLAPDAWARAFSNVSALIYRFV